MKQELADYLNAETDKLKAEQRASRMTNKEIKAALASDFPLCSVRKGIWKVKKSYFWGISGSGDQLFSKVQSLLPKLSLRMHNHGNHFHSFVGGAKSGTAKDSYWWLEFTVN